MPSRVHPYRSSLPLVLALALTIATLLGSAAAQDPEPVYGGTVTVAITADPPGWDPTVSTSQEIPRVMYHNVYEGLVRFDATGTIVPALAESYTTSDDGLTWTFTLRDDFPWVTHDPATGETAILTDEEGNELYVTADDVVYGIKRTLDPATASTYAYVLYNVLNGAAVNSGEEGLTVDDLGVAAPDAQTVVITLENPAPYFPGIAAMWIAAPMPAPADSFARALADAGTLGEVWGEVMRAGGAAGRLLEISLRLAFRSPFEPGNVFGHLAATAVPGVEEWRDGAYRRTLRLPHGAGFVALAPRPDHVAATLHLADPRDLTPAIGRCRRLLDLDADPVAVDAALATDPALAPLVEATPGRRVPRTVDPHEFALRAVLGQQVSTAAARTHAARLVALARAVEASDAVVRLLVAGCVGGAAAHEFLAWAAAQDLPDSRAILEDPTGAWFTGARADHVYVTLQGVVGAATQAGTPQAWSAAVVACCTAADQAGVDPAVPAVRALLRTRPAGAALPPEVKVFASVLALAGLLPGAGPGPGATGSGGTGTGRAARR